MQGCVQEGEQGTVSHATLPVPLTTDISLIYCQSTSHSIRKQTKTSNYLVISTAF